MLKLPYPDLPYHTDNLASLELLEAQGWRGTDASLEISLLEYDFLYRELGYEDADGDDHVFIYRVNCHLGGRRYDRVGLNSKLNLKKEYNWVEWESFLAAQDMSWKKWSKLPFALRIYDLLNYYGYENIFGSCYWEGFTIEV